MFISDIYIGAVLIASLVLTTASATTNRSLTGDNRRTEKIITKDFNLLPFTYLSMRR